MDVFAECVSKLRYNSIFRKILQVSLAFGDMNDRKSGQNLPVFTCDSKDLIDCDFAVTKTSFVELRFMIKDSTTMLMKLKAFLVIL